MTSAYQYRYSNKSTTGFVGLVNQAMTCYLNSFLQTLYMTPEFRNAVYRWEFKGNEEEGAKSIPYQLQRLFLHLQTSDKRAVETTGITKSFGWDSNEAWQQHDVQELCRVMFDALEKRFKKDEHHETSKDLINDLYRGVMKDYVKCLECGYEGAHEVSFLDIQLDIKPFGSSTTLGSVGEALDAFVRPGTLQDDNKYHCHQCDKKCDAHKGFKFQHFPYILTLHLKRFDFDYSTMQRIKLNDRMTFPNILDLNGYIDGGDESSLSEQELLEMYGDFVAEKFEQKPPPYSASYATPTDPAPSPEDDDVITGEKVAKLLAKGPYVYELFSIMVHSGSAIGGHYYAYIKSFSDRQWYCFNDQSVSRISLDDLKRTFGGVYEDLGAYSALYNSTGNAYMLMYRRIDKKSNGRFSSSESLPKHILRQIEEEREAERKEQERQEWERNHCKFRLFCRHPVTKERVEKKMEIHINTTLSETVALAHKLHNLDGVVPVERCRLVRYDEYTETLDQSFDENKDLLTFGDHVGGARTYYSFELFLEIRGEGEEFRSYNKGGLNLKVLIIDLPEATVREPIQFRAEQTWKVQDLKEELAKRFGLDKTTMNIALELFNNERKHLSNDDSALRSENFYRKHTIYVCCDAEDISKDFKSSEMYQVIDKHANEILLFISIPPPPPPPSARKPLNSRQTNNKVVDQSNASNETTADINSSPDAQSEDTAMEVQPSSEDIADTSDTADTSDVSKEKQVDSERPLRKTIELRIDRRCTLAELKTRLEEYIQVPSSEFKIYRNYSDNPEEYEMNRTQDSLKSVQNETRLIVRPARSLQSGEVAVKLSLLEVTKTEFFRPLMNSIVAKGMTVRQFKKQVVEEAYEQGVEVNLDADRMRLRKKTWRSPCTIFLDSQIFDRDIHVFANFEVYIECLEAADEKMDSSQTQVYVRHWHPSTYTIDKTQEIILSDKSPEHLKLKLSQLSGIPPERIWYAKASGSFPCEISMLDIESELEWNPTVTTISSMPLSIYDDGSILYFKDCEEVLAELTPDERAALEVQEKARVGKYSSSSSSGGSSHHSYHRRRDDGLQIKDWTEESERGNFKRLPL